VSRPAGGPGGAGHVSRTALPFLAGPAGVQPKVN
jgi:hypothetical protein